MNAACCPCRCRRVHGGSRHTWPRSGSGRQRTAALRCAALYMPSGAQVRRTGKSELTPDLACGRSAGALSGSPAHRSTLGCQNRMASDAHSTRSPRLGRRAARLERRALGRTFRAPGCSGIRQRHTDHRPSLCATGPGPVLVRAAAGSSEPRRALLRFCFGPSGRRNPVCTYLSAYYAMCQGCHLHYDRAHHAETARATRDAAQGQGTLL